MEPQIRQYVMDAYALLAFLGGEVGADVVQARLSEPDTLSSVHAVNLCEVFYQSLRDTDRATAEQGIADLLALGLVVREDLDTAFWQQVGEFKVNPGRLSLADCFALALAQREGATLVTTDHHEFDRVVPLNVATILFIR